MKHRFPFQISRLLSSKRIAALILTILMVVSIYFLYIVYKRIYPKPIEIRNKNTIATKDTPPSIILKICGREYKIFMHGEKESTTKKLTRVSQLLTETNNQEACHLIDVNAIDGTIVSGGNMLPYGYLGIGSVSILIDEVNNYIALSPYTQDDIIGPYVDGKPINTNEMEMFIVKEYLPTVFCGKTYFSQSYKIRSENFDMVKSIAALAEHVPNSGICEEVAKIAGPDKYIQIYFGNANTLMGSYGSGYKYENGRLRIGSFVFFVRDGFIFYRGPRAENLESFSVLGRTGGVIMSTEEQEVRGDTYIQLNNSLSTEKDVCEKTLQFPVITIQGKDIVERFIEIAETNTVFKDILCLGVARLEDGAFVTVRITDSIHSDGEKGPYTQRKGVYNVTLMNWTTFQIDAVKNSIYQNNEFSPQSFGPLFK